MDEFTQMIFSEHGRTFRFVLPRLIDARAIAYNMHQRVIDYFVDIAKGRKINYIVDVGAHIGMFALPYTVMFPDAAILCLEPSSSNYPYLKFNCKDCPQIETRRIVAHNQTAKIRISAPTVLQRSDVSHDANSGLISVYGKSDKYAEIVNADTLDNIVKRKVDWLKIDVEGHELAVLDGAERIISRDRPILQIEVRDENQKMAHRTANGLMDSVIKIGYVMRGAITADIIFVPK